MCERAVDEGAVREIGAYDPGFGLEERRPAVRNADRPAPARLGGVEQLVLSAGRVERILRALRRALRRARAGR